MSKKRTAALGAGVLSALLAGGIAFAPTAAAQTEDSAFAIEATGLISIPKTPHVVGEGEESFLAVNLPPEQRALVHAGVLNAEAANGYAKASVAKAEVNLGQNLNLGVELVSAECDDLSGKTSIAAVTLNGKKIALDQLGPNTEIIPKPLQGVARLTLNKQVESEDALTVTALSVDLLNSTQTIDVASATCTEKDAEPTEPTEPTQPTEPTESTEPTTPPDNGDGGDDDGDDELPGSRPDEDGKAPTPVPQPGHLDVTG